jgi:hypothetical protein
VKEYFDYLDKKFIFFAEIKETKQLAIGYTL